LFIPPCYIKIWYHFLVVIEEGDATYGAYVPDLPGCVAVADTREEVERSIREAIIMHLDGMLQDHEPIPTCDCQPKSLPCDPVKSATLA
jgi:predicted RNase H-like HicB family nuclease